MISLKSLRQFLVAAARSGYGNPKVVIDKATDGANTISYDDGDWQLIDIFYGGHPYAGQEIVYHRSRAVWAMQYRGWVTETDLTPGQVYDFLKQALLATPVEHPYRGPRELTNQELSYRNRWEGDAKNFSGYESISKNDRQVYRGLYFGGLVDEPAD